MRKIICIFNIIIVFLLIGCSGDSAYDLAVQNGFNGTVEDYLESLKGSNSNITITDIFESLVELGEYNSDEYLIFLKDYLSINCNDEDVIMNNSLCSAVSISSTFGNILKSTYYGSGVIYKIDNEGYAYIITNHHVVVNPNNFTDISSNIKVYIYGYEYSNYSYEASYIGSYSDYDVSILKVKFDLNGNAKYVQAADIYDDRIYVGDMIYAIGNSLGEGLSITKGIISVDSEEISTGYDVRVMRIDAAVNGGNSGGPLFNKDGLLIGIIDAKVVDEEVEGMCYALPISYVSNIADNIISNNSDVVLVDLEFTYKSTSSSLYYNQNNNKYYIKEIVVIDDLLVSSNLYKLGLRSGDQLLSIEYINKTFSIERYFTLTDLLFLFSADDQIILNTYRVDTQKFSSYTIVF